MEIFMSSLPCLVIGNQTLLIQCSEILLQRGHQINGVVTRDPQIRTWAEAKGLRVVEQGADLAGRLEGINFDWLLSIGNLNIIPEAVISQAAAGAVNFHDGPLPRYAGLNAPVWAILNGETSHGVTWHMLEGGIDEGDILEQATFEIAPGETALTLNMKCFGAAIESFAGLTKKIEAGAKIRIPQDFKHRSYFARDDRPVAAARLDFQADAGSLVALVGALDHGGYWNPLACPKIEVSGKLIAVSGAEIADGFEATNPGKVLDVSSDSLVVATGSQPVRLIGLKTLAGSTIEPASIIASGDMLDSLDASQATVLSAQMAAMVHGEGYWRRQLLKLDPATLPGSTDARSDTNPARCPLELPDDMSPDKLMAAIGAWCLRSGSKTSFDLAYRDDAIGAADTKGFLSSWVPVRFDGETTFAKAAETFAQTLAAARENITFASDLALRDPEIGNIAIPDIGLSVGNNNDLIDGTRITVALSGTTAEFVYDSATLSENAAAMLASRLEFLAAAIADGSNDDTQVTQLPVLPAAELEQVLHGWNQTATDYDQTKTVHQLFEEQVTLRPDATAVVFEGEELTYEELNSRANRAAHVLQQIGIGPDTFVGLYMPRSAEMLTCALAILKAGGAYVPLDPAYPADRIALYIEDSAASVIVTHSSIAANLPVNEAKVLVLDTDPRVSSAPDANPDSGVAPDNLAYMIYTSGSTGKPKGVMVEHCNVSNFFTGMDDRISHKDGDVWLAVTSLSFDISVLELFWTLARGFKVVLSGDENRALVAGDSGASRSIGGMEFSLYYWGNDDGVGRDKYRTLLEGAKFGDQNGFCAVWTPERHFHAFGGPYPNPSVTGAAVAAVTQNIGVRAGSCVAPLHHTARIAEEWAIVDNLTNGRAGLAIASGWQPDDFVLRPENSPPDNKPAMFQAIADLRKLWAGEKVAFPRKDGTPFEVLTQPRPVSKKLNVWVTTAGNPGTWKEAGRNGCNVLTHLLGQSVAEVGDKIKLYHEALREAGHNPDDFTVTLMLHSFLAETRDQAREIAREPMKDYLRAAAGLIKQYAWAFPAFKRPKGVDNAFQLDLGSLNEEELEGILDFAFDRYFNDSGLFGTVEDALARVAEVKAIGVTEIACLIDYGIDIDTILESLKPLAEVLRLSNTETELAEDDYSIAAQIIRHNVTHMQCTPSMAQMLVMNDEARAALSHLDHMMIGGEALPGALAGELANLTGAHIENMYGPTETTIWSTTETVTPTDGVVNIGTPIANTQVYVLDDKRQPAPIGVAGELYIAGAGVTRGYWQRPDLTDEQFVPDPFTKSDSPARMYRTGDLVRWRGDGRLDFIGRADHQIKIRGYRIELGEIETALETAGNVRQAVTIVREDTPGDKRIVAYLLADGVVDVAGLRAQLNNTLPAHMVPAHFVELDEFPLTPNRKIDRKALPIPTNKKATVQDASSSAPENQTEKQIAEIWKRVLGVTGVGAKDNFFDLGGHSLLAVQAHRDIRDAFGSSRLSITDIFRFPTLATLAGHIDGQMQPKNKPAEANKGKLAEKALTRSDAMAKRRAMRARRVS